MRALVAVFLLLTITCATPGGGGGIIQVAKDCTIQAGRDTAGPAIAEIESAVAMPTVASALAALERIAGTYGIAFVSCVVDRVTDESRMNLLRSNNQDPIAMRKMVNGRAWLDEHPSGL